MRNTLNRLRAALHLQTSSVLWIGVAMLAILFLCGQTSKEITLEERVEQFLLQIEGIDEADVVVRTTSVLDTQSASLWKGNEAREEVPYGAIAVIKGESNVLLQMEVTQALSSLLGLPASAVSVIQTSVENGG